MSSQPCILRTGLSCSELTALSAVRSELVQWEIFTFIFISPAGLYSLIWFGLWVFLVVFSFSLKKSRNLLKDIFLSMKIKRKRGAVEGNKTYARGAGEMAPWVRAQSALLKDMGSIPNTHLATHSCL